MAISSHRLQGTTMLHVGGRVGRRSMRCVLNSCFVAPSHSSSTFMLLVLLQTQSIHLKRDDNTHIHSYIHWSHLSHTQRLRVHQLLPSVTMICANYVACEDIDAFRCSTRENKFFLCAIIIITISRMERNVSNVARALC